MKLNNIATDNINHYILMPTKKKKDCLLLNVDRLVPEYSVLYLERCLVLNYNLKKKRITSQNM